MAQISRETSDTHFYGMILQRTKNGWNIGAVLRAAGCFGASFVAVEGLRYKEHRADFRHMDTEFARKRIPLFLGVPDASYFIPYETEVVYIDRKDGAIPLPEFEHPRRAVYVFGPEDGSVEERYGPGKTVYIPSDGSLNLAAACYITQYDRKTKTDAGVYKVSGIVCPNCAGVYTKKVSNELSETGEVVYHCNACGHNWTESFT